MPAASDERVSAKASVHLKAKVKRWYIISYIEANPQVVRYLE